MEKLRAKADGLKTLADTSKIVSTVFISLNLGCHCQNLLPLLESKVLVSLKNFHFNQPGSDGDGQQEPLP